MNYSASQFCRNTKAAELKFGITKYRTGYLGAYSSPLSLATLSLVLTVTLALAGCGSSAPGSSEPGADAGHQGDTSPHDEHDGCASGEMRCNGECIDVTGDPANCGGCGMQCAPGWSCADGACVLDCPDGKTPCDAACYDLLTSIRHCGECGNYCTMGTICIEGECEEGCRSGLTMCDGRCVNPDTDPQHCGQCFNECSTDEVCAGGFCLTDCPDGLEECFGGCVNVHVDPFNCGRCGHSCDSGEVCYVGQCLLSCQDGLVDCGGLCVNTYTDRAHCGGCNTPCAPGQVCSSGDCLLSCQEGLTNCLGSCVNLDNDLSNCGTCGGVCAPGHLCSDGECVLNCPTELTACAGGCVDLANNRNHCGGCGVACGAGMVCEGGGCLLSCPDNMSICDNQCTDTNVDHQHCGQCNNPCPPGFLCHGGECVANCPAGFEQCGEQCVQLESNPAHCGSCDTACPSGALCEGGQCQLQVSGVRLNRSNLQLTLEETFQLTATVEPSGAPNQAMVWNSSNSRIAAVDSNGKVMAIREGQARITVTTVESGHTADCLVTVLSDGGGGNGEGSLNCQDVWTCGIDCEQDDQACIDECLAAGTNEGRSQAEDLATCIEESDCPAGDQVCLYSSCWAQITTCFPRATGHLECGGIFSCLDSCPPDSPNCSWNCYQSATSEAQLQYELIFACQDMNCAPEDSACLNSMCREYIEECFYGPPGTATCDEVYMCMVQCSNDGQGSQCSDECYLSGSHEARRELRQMFNCFNRSGCPSNDTLCLLSMCGTEIIACGLR